ncbi:MAG: tRNA 2-thiouridine(34) synthase MnmA [Magnetococcales bacterium]|nr:tRNA 2-thiouridine(34) synthase MnmA [Magnetococcales bacterium]
MKKKKRIAVAMSGGVDSSTAAALLKEQGHDVIGLTMRLWSDASSCAPSSRACCAPEDIYDARRVAESLDIPFYVVDYEVPFQRHVVDDFIRSYTAGKTPNPCIRCNQSMKFERLLAKAQALGADALATGHYARIVQREDGHPELWRGLDRRKDQSYFLFATTLGQLAHIAFPLGGLSKAETRQVAERAGLHVEQKAESQDLCFVPDQDYRAFFQKHAPEALRAGEIVHQDGQLLGQHKGLPLYTIGQRRGLGIAAKHPLYVIRIDAALNQLVVGPKEALLSRSFVMGDLNWLGREPPNVQTSLEARIRYAAQPAPAIVEPLEKNRLRVTFSTLQHSITPGQAAVLYRGDRVLGGGWILESEG